MLFGQRSHPKTFEDGHVAQFSFHAALKSQFAAP